MPNLKDVVTMVLVVVLLASLGYWYIVLPEYLAEKKRRQELNPQGWISVKERLPEVMSTVIVSGRMKYAWETDYFRFVDVATYDGELFETFNDWYEGQQDFEITHWMPLPEPPKEKNEHDI